MKLFDFRDLNWPQILFSGCPGLLLMVVWQNTRILWTLLPVLWTLLPVHVSVTEPGTQTLQTPIRSKGAVPTVPLQSLFKLALTAF